MAYIRISAYTDKLSVKPGDTLRVMASADATDIVRAQLVRLIHGDEHPDGPGFVERPVASPIDREWLARKQYIQKGNFLRVADPHGKLAPTGPLTLHAYIFPTLLGAGRQVLLGRWSVDATSGFALGINPSGRLEFWVGDGAGADAVAAEVRLIPRVWYFVAASYDPASGVATIYQEAVINRYNSLLSAVVPYDYHSHVRETLRVRPTMPVETGFVIGAATERNQARGTFVSQCYNGKIDRCGVQGSALDRSALDAIRAGARPDPAGVLADWTPARISCTPRATIARCVA
jgi:N,N-dimethylformamidase